jgi:hypothetical protein
MPPLYPKICTPGSTPALTSAMKPWLGLHRLLKEFKRRNANAVVMEISAIALNSKGNPQILLTGPEIQTVHVLHKGLIAMANAAGAARKP